jgi:uncharacterized protein YjiS (DUF1127 family)
MNRFYLGTITVVALTTALTSNIIATGIRGAAQPGLSMGARLVARRCSRRFGRAVDAWVAAMIARRERLAASAALRQMTDRELTDVGLYRGEIDNLAARCGPSRDGNVEGRS